MEPIALWVLIPFVLMLLGIAIGPLVVPHWWEKDVNKILYSLVLAVPTIAYLLNAGYTHEVVHQMVFDYVPFIVLVGSLFVITGGIHIRLNLSPTPFANTMMLLVGYLLASIMGTTGAALLLVRPLLRMNEHRVYKAHLMLFLIALVANCGGLLTPLGDPPLFMLFLRGVPFGWFSGLYPAWMLVGGVMLLIYYCVDKYLYKKEGASHEHPVEGHDGAMVRCKGATNFYFLAGVVLTVAYVNAGYIPAMADENAPIYIKLLREFVLLVMAAASWYSTAKNVRVSNFYSWEPLTEVIILFFGVFATMTPALLYLQAHACEIGISSPSGFYYVTGALSSFLDNTPTAVAFHTLALEFSAGCTNLVGGVREAYLVAISIGAVFFGAMTYIGNGPNFMVKSIAEQDGVKMPGFFGYIARFSIPVLLPVYIVIQLLFVS